MVCRFLIGIGQGVINPAYSVLIAAWTPLSERSTMVTIVFAGSQVGGIVSMRVTVILILRFSVENKRSAQYSAR